MEVTLVVRGNKKSVTSLIYILPCTARGTRSDLEKVAEKTLRKNRLNTYAFVGVTRLGGVKAPVITVVK